MKYKILASCLGCKQCFRICPVGSITKGPMKINDDKCIKCGECFRRCPSKKIIEVKENV